MNLLKVQTSALQTKHASLSFRYYNPHKFVRSNEPKAPKPQFCKYCGLSKKASISSAKRLTKFVVFVAGVESERTTESNKSEFNFDRSMEFCNASTCDGPPARPDYAELHRLAELDLGPGYNRARFIKWRQGRTFASENGKRPNE